MKKFSTLFLASVCAMNFAAAAADTLELTLDWDNDDNRDLTVFEAGETIVIPSVVEGGEAPYTYRWVTSRGEEVGTDATLTVKASLPEAYRLFVTSADGQTATQKVNVFVNTHELAVAGFDDLPLESESSWPGDNLVEETQAFDALFSGSMHFTNSYMPDWNYWCGYSFANETATGFDGLQHQFRNAVGGGAAGTANYGVCFSDYADTRIYLTHADKGFVIPGVYVTNSAYTLNSAVNGDGFCPAFTKENGDYYTLVFESVDDDNNVLASVKVNLIDYRTDEPEIVTDWKYVDLTSLGEVRRLRIDRESTQRDFCPAYACIDELGAENTEGAAPAVAADLSQLKLTLAASDILSVLGTDSAWTMDVFTPDGVARAFYKGTGASTVSTSALTPGIYIARVTADGATRTLRFVRR